MPIENKLHKAHVLIHGVEHEMLLSDEDLTKYAASGMLVDKGSRVDPSEDAASRRKAAPAPANKALAAENK